jgi:chemotaxis protein histidine kinase CheA
MVATDFEIKFAQSRIDYFDKVLKKGENDKVKTLLKAIKVEGGTDFSASEIAKAIKAAKEVEQKDKDAAVKAADAALTKATTDDTNAKATAKTAADALTTATTGDTNAKATAKTAADNLTKATEAKKAADAGNDAAAKEKAAAALTEATTDDTNAKATAKTAADNLTTATTGDTNAKATAKTAADNLTTATEAKTKADDMVVGDSPVLTAAKALLGDNTVKAIKADDGTDDAKLTALYVDKAPEFLKDYGFINAIAKNIPNAGKDVLTAGTGTFSAYKSDTLKDDALKAGNAYFKIIATVCGTGPFETADLPEKDAHSEHVKNCLSEANKVAFTILSIDSCGKDKLQDSKVDDACYEGLADKGVDLYITADFDKMHTDLSGEYPYDKVFSELDAIA